MVKPCDNVVRLCWFAVLRVNTYLIVLLLSQVPRHPTTGQVQTKGLVILVETSHLATVDTTQALHKETLEDRH